MAIVPLSGNTRANSCLVEIRRSVTHPILGTSPLKNAAMSFVTSEQWYPLFDSSFFVPCVDGWTVPCARMGVCWHATMSRILLLQN